MALSAKNSIKPKKVANPCIAILGGSFDPVHVGHVALAELIYNLLKPTQLRIIPTGWSSQKAAFRASPQQRVAMLSLAFAELSKKTSLLIDTQEIRRAELGVPSYSVDTLSLLRDEFGSLASLILVIGADQLQQLQHWHRWQEVMTLAHIVVATRPGFELDKIDELVAQEFKQRLGSIEQLRNSPCGHTYLSDKLSIAISSTEIRGGNKLSSVPPDVLNYLQQHPIY